MKKKRLIIFIVSLIVLMFLCFNIKTKEISDNYYLVVNYDEGISPITLYADVIKYSNTDNNISNEDIATITQFGTLLTKSEGSIRITCVDKTNFYNLYYCDIIIVSDDNFNDINHENDTLAYLVDSNNNTSNLEISYNETKYIRLNYSISPFIQDYNWTVSDTDIISVSNYGTIRCIDDTFNGFITINGINKYNSNYAVTLLIEVNNI